MKSSAAVWIIFITINFANAGKRRDRVKLSDAPAQKVTAKINVQYLHVITQIQARFATSLIICKIGNEAKKDQEVTFTAVLPDAAFISNFTMLINEKLLIGDVKEKAEAKLAYDIAKSKGESAGHVAQKPRETNEFQISVNVAARSHVTFNLTYQEMLKRVHGVYKHIINLQPDQPVDHMLVDVYINERGEIKNIHVPKFGERMGEKTNKELLKQEEEKNYSIQKSISDKTSNVHISFKPSNDGRTIINGQMVVLYDVTRSKNGGDIEVVDGYFVHFMAPEGLKSGKKHVIFVLDKSGSMTGRKIEQLKDAMNTILSDLDSNDIFNIIMFSTEVTLWKSESVPASSDNIQNAKTFVQKQNADGSIIWEFSTALNDALLRSVQLLNADNTNTLTAMILFMTDGQPTEGETNTETIVNNVNSANTKRYPINCVAFGEDADYNMMQKISSKNRGLARKVFEDSDATLQLTGFFDEIRTPLLTEVQVTYLNDAVDVNSLVQDQVVNYYEGGEIVIFGKMKNPSSELQATMKGKGASGSVTMDGKAVGWACPAYDNLGMVPPQFGRCCPMPSTMPMAIGGSNVKSRVAIAVTPNCCWGWYDYCPSSPPHLPNPVLPANTVGGFVERMWAYKTIKKYLKQVELDDAPNTAPTSSSLRQKALQLSLKYHFVTELTSMVVTDPNQKFTHFVDKNQKKNKNNNHETNTQDEKGPVGTGSGSSAVGGNNQNSLSVGNRKKGGNQAKGNTSPNTSPNNANRAGCSLDIVIVMDQSGTSLIIQENANLVRKLIDQLASKFSQTIRMAVIFVGANVNGKSNLIQPIVPVVSNAGILKDATKKSSSLYNSELQFLMNNVFSTAPKASSQAIVFFTGSQSLQYAADTAQKLKQNYSGIKIFAVSTGGGQTSKSLEQITGSSENSFVSPETSDLADAFSC